MQKHPPAADSDKYLDLSRDADHLKDPAEIPSSGSCLTENSVGVAGAMGVVYLVGVACPECSV